MVSILLPPGTLSPLLLESIPLSSPVMSLLFSLILFRYGNKFSGQDMCTLNQLSNCNNLAIGQVLKVPCPTGACGQYTVGSGDTLTVIAGKYLLIHV